MEDDAGDTVTAVSLISKIADASNTSEDGWFEIDVMTNGSALSYLNLYPGEISFNDDSNDIDFRVESNDDTHMLFVDGGNNRVGIGKTPAAQPFEVAGFSVFDTGMVINEGSNDSDFRVESNGNANMLFVDAGANAVGIGTGTPSALLNIQDATGPHFRLTRTSGHATGQIGSIDFGNADVDTQLAAIVVSGDGSTSNAHMSFHTEADSVAMLERMRITSVGDMVWFDDDGSTEGMRWDASADGLFVGNTTAIADVGGVVANITTDVGFGVADGSNEICYKIDRINFNAGNFYVLNESSAGVKLVNGATSWATQSDENLKENIAELSGVLDKVKSYRCVTYNLKSQKKADSKIGFIAQDWQGDFGQVIDADEDGTLGMRYTETIPVLLRAMQEQQEIIESLTDRIAALEGE